MVHARSFCNFLATDLSRFSTSSQSKQRVSGTYDKESGGGSAFNGSRHTFGSPFTHKNLHHKNDGRSLWSGATAIDLADVRIIESASTTVQR